MLWSGRGGFALIQGDPGTGKSMILRLVAERLSQLPDLIVGAIHHPQSNLADFYRERGDIFAVSIKPSNRWGGFDHAMGNYRVLTQTAAELLAAAAQRQLDPLDEKLFLELYGPPQQPARRKTAR